MPEPWTIETLTRRQIAFGDATSELQLARAVAELGAAEANRLHNPDPWDDLKIPEGFNPAIVDSTRSAARGIGSRALRPALLPEYRPTRDLTPDTPPGRPFVRAATTGWSAARCRRPESRSSSNDPHREVTLPSLRYIVHLQAPGWNVIGATEPPFLAVAAGHNDRLGWGLTIVGTDQHDVFVEEPESGGSGFGPVERRVGAAAHRPRRDQGQGRSGADRGA